MPTISWFYGISIRMFFNNHPPPHFHAYYEGSVAVINIETGEVTTGRLPPRILRLVEAWRARYIAELRDVWARARRGDREPLGRIPGLDDE
jgi:hypothetical protein